MHHAEAPRLIGIKAVTGRTSLSEASIRRAIERRAFPKPLKISRNRVAWREADVNEWINSRVEAA